MNVLHCLRHMVGRSLFFRLVVLFLSYLHLSACQEDSAVPLDDTDRCFAGFYSDYLVHSGVSAHEEDVVLAPLPEKELEAMLARHALSRERMEKRLELYRKQPQRWKRVVELVRAEVRKKKP